MVQYLVMCKRVVGTAATSIATSSRPQPIPIVRSVDGSHHMMPPFRDTSAKTLVCSSLRPHFGENKGNEGSIHQGFINNGS